MDEGRYFLTSFNGNMYLLLEIGKRIFIHLLIMSGSAYITRITMREAGSLKVRWMDGWMGR